MRVTREIVVAGTFVLAGLLAGSVWATTVVGTSKSDVLRGSARADRLDGRAGNDKLYGYAGNDVLIGGPGADQLACGVGRDTAFADAKDSVRKDCEVVRGLPKQSPPLPPPPPPPPPLPKPRDGHYAGKTSQLEEIGFDVGGGGTIISNLRFKRNESCQPSLQLNGYITASGPLAVAPDGSWAVTGSGTVTSGRIVGVFVATVEGTLGTSGNASGTLLVETVTVAPFPAKCTSYTQTWTAAIP